MMKISTSDWVLIAGHFDHLVDLPTGERQAALHALNIEDIHYQQLVHLLEQHARADSLGLDTAAPERLGLEHEAHDHGESPFPEWQGQRLGPWQVDEIIGHGGMSVIYRGHRADGEFDKEVAIKVLNRAHLVGDAGRLKEETQILARLDHPDIARLIDSGTSDAGHGYLVMELIRGQALDRFCQRHAASADKIIQLILAAARALEYAHQRQVVHCDIKPANLLVRDNGQLCVVDFGIAAMIQRQPDAGRHLYCSPAYTAPERFSGAPPDTRQDVYSLGAVMRLVLPEDTDRDLKAICERATAAEVEGRYDSVTSFRTDLESWRARRPVAAREGGYLYGLQRWLQRHAIIAALASVLVASLVIGTAVSLWQAGEARNEAARALAARDFLVGIFEAADPELASGEDPPASELLRRGADQVRTAMADQPRLLAELLYVIGRIQLERGLNDDAARSLDEVLSMEATGRTPELLSNALSDRGMVAYNQGDAGAGARLIKQARALALDHGLGKARLNELEVRLADILVAGGRADEALAVLGQALERMQAFGNDDQAQLLIEARRVHGAALQLGNRLEEAKTVLEQALAGQIALDEDGIERAMIENDLGIVYWYLGEFDLAARAFGRSLGHKRRIYGENHQQTLTGLGNLAGVELMRGDHVAAEEAWLESLQILDRIHSGPHPDIAYTWGMLAWSAYRQDDFTTALDRAAMALQHRRALKGAHHSTNTDWLLPLRGLLLLETGQGGDALEALQAHTGDCLDLAAQTELGQRICLARRLLETDLADTHCAPQSLPAADDAVLERLPLRWRLAHALIAARCRKSGELPQWPGDAGTAARDWLTSRLATIN